MALYMFLPRHAAIIEVPPVLIPLQFQSAVCQCVRCIFAAFVGFSCVYVCFVCSAMHWCLPHR